MQLKIGQYTVMDDDGERCFQQRYLVRRIMKKTAEISAGVSLDYADFSYDSHYRYPIDLLEQQINSDFPTEFLPFKSK